MKDFISLSELMFLHYLHVYLYHFLKEYKKGLHAHYNLETL